MTELLPQEGYTLRLMYPYRNIQIGALSYCPESSEPWRFEYATAFKNSGLKPLRQFPDVNIIYHSQRPWPYFVDRLPGLKQPHIAEFLRREGIAHNDYPRLLRRFGHKPIISPFTLEPA